MDFSLQIAPDLHSSSFFLVDRYDFYHINIHFCASNKMAECI